ncbi:thioredoxin family protein [Actinomadura harenae]|uniref:Thioredoxin n=1 Tax=Actinomadura harenae TaxID=2483351 RepID=A0A3M2LHK0_9ACTN|nr:thioredoxin family protein [Actinomadura harenae]RMI36586.1 thioredoxin [Actinomadura harenae]
MPAQPAVPVDSVTEQTFPTRVLQAEKPVLIQFWATWCAPCRRVTPIVEELAAEHADRLDVVKVDIDEEEALTIQHRISGVPAFIVYVDGQIKESWVGAAPKNALEKRLAAYLR